MNRINFRTTSLMKNFKKALKASHHIQGGETVRFTIGSDNKLPFPRNTSVDKFIDLIINELTENPIIHNNFSIDYLEKNIIFILEDLEINNAL